MDLIATSNNRPRSPSPTAMVSFVLLVDVSRDSSVRQSLIFFEARIPTAFIDQHLVLRD
jgi:hypothetical protein